MANLMTRELREMMIEQEKHDIPYNSTGFTKWLTEIAGRTAESAARQVELIRTADIELWSPGDPEIFNLIPKWIEEAEKSTPAIRTLLSDFAVDAISGYIDDLAEIRDEVKKNNLPLLEQIIEAYTLYRAFIESTLAEYISEKSDDVTISKEDKAPVRYPLVPLDDEFKSYLDSCKYPTCTRDRMMTNLRKLNHIVINNGRGDSDWLQKIVDKATSGCNIRYARMTAHTLVHNALQHTSDYNVSESDLRGGQTAINQYVKFLILRQSMQCMGKN
ncbi:MAG: hypothetical protein K2H74_06470 [Paramuribaculum sp.]|nr:hypothetical protein [Paramuribaculum sp.]